MLTQLLLEQDLQDRKQIGLFGTKTNSQIMNNNQGAMTNNYKKTADAGRTQIATPADQDKWDLYNRRKSYDQVVRPNG